MTFVLAKLAGFELTFVAPHQPAPDAELYLVPSLRGHRPIPRRRFQAILDRVRAGATLYLSLDDGLPDGLEALAGVEVIHRSRREGALNLTGEDLPEIPLSTPFRLTLRATRAEVLAAESDGNPLFTRAALGRGWVYFLAGSPEKDVRERAQAIRQKESDLQNRAWRMEAQMPSQMAKTVLAQANQRMDEARQGLDRQETGADTQRQQQHAEQTLGRLARSLERAAQASLFQQQTGQSQTPEAQLAAQLGDMEAARELEAQIRQETQGIQSRREAQPNQEMTPKLRRETEMAAQSQAQNQWQTYSIGDRLRDMPDYTQPLRQASRQMEEVRAQLEKRETGQPTQANEEKIVSQLDQLVARARKEMEQQRSKMLGSSKPQNSARKADTPSPKSNAPLVQADSAALGAFRPGGRGFGPLSPKAQQLMRQGRQERVPAEYRELVNQYYKALSERGR
jgi:hypothetical protein